MSIAAARPAVAVRPLADRFLAAVPVVTLYVLLCFLYGWEAWGHAAPWLNSDELETAQLSRSIAETGEPARRGVPYPTFAVYPRVLAPVWLIEDVGTAYAAAKYVNVLLMTAVVFPTYGLARMLVARPWALFAAAGAGTIPALYYSSMLIEESLAYSWAALAAFLIARALATRRVAWIVGAAAVSLVAPLVREQLAVVPAAFVLATLALVAVSARAKREYTRWTRGDWVGAITLLAGAVIVVNAAISHVSYSWLIAPIFYKDRMVVHGLWAAGALTIGVGVLPVIAGLAALVRPRGERWTPELRAFVATAVAFVVGFGWYTAIKASYISTTFSTLIVERNLIYVAPVLFVATAMFFERPWVRWWAAAGAAALALAAVLLAHPYQMQLRIYSDAPGFALLQAANRAYGWTPDRAQNVVVGMIVISLVVLVLPRLLPRISVVLAGVATLLIAWTLSGQMSAASASNEFSDELIANIDKPLDWIDRETHGAPTVYIGQRLTDYNGVWQMEFWNRSLDHVWSTDGSAPGPGPTLTPDLVDARTGAITPVDVEYVVADPGIDIVGEIVARHTHSAAGTPVDWTLVKIAPPLRLQNSVRGVFQDGWAGRNSSYSQFTTPGNRAGFAYVRVHRRGWGGKDRPGIVRIRVGTLVLGEDKHPALGDVTSTCSFRINRLEDRKFLLATPPPPFHVSVEIRRTFVPQELDPRAADTRELGAQLEFSFSPTETVPPERRGCTAGLRGPGR